MCQIFISTLSQHINLRLVLGSGRALISEWIIMVIIRSTVEISSRLKNGSLMVHGLHFLSSGCMVGWCLLRVRLRKLKKVIVVMTTNGKLPRTGSSTFKVQE